MIAGLYITFSIGGLGEVVNMAALHSRGVWGHAPQGNFDD